MYSNIGQSQVKNIKNLQQNRSLISKKIVVDRFRRDPQEYVLGLTPTGRRLLNTVIGFSITYKNPFPSTTTLANACGVRRETIARALPRLKKDGLLTWIPTYRRSSMYIINPVLRMPWMVQLLSPLLPSLRRLLFFSLSVSTLLSCDSIGVADGKGHTYPDTKRIYNKKPNYRNSTIRKTSAREEGGGNAPGKGEEKVKKVTGRKEMEEGGLKGYRYTVAGLVELCGFSREAIEYAQQVGGKSKGVKDLFSYIYAVAKKWHKDRGIEVNHAKVAKYRIEAGVGVGEEKIEKIAMPVREGSSPSVAITKTKEEIEEIVKKNESNQTLSAFVGVLRSRCKDSLENGETIHRTQAELDRQERRQRKLEEDMVRFRSIKEGEGVASEKDERGSITTNDIVPGHVSTWQATGTSAQFEFRDKITGVRDRWEAVGIGAAEILSKIRPDV